MSAGLAAPLCLLGCLCAAGSAYGSTAELRPSGSDGRPPSFEYSAGPGEANEVEITASLDGDIITVVAIDGGASITARQGCAADGAHSVRCQYDTGSHLTAQITLADGNDSAKLVFRASAGFFPDAGGSVPGTGIRGGTGDDRLAGPDGEHVSAGLRGGPGDDLLIGGTADDWLNGGGGVDELHGGPGRNSLTDGDRSGSADGDVLDGGGEAALGYRSRTRPLRVDLNDHRSAGEAGEGDRVSGMTDVHGGRGADVLVGTPRANYLNGGDGADRLYGRGGDDRLELRSRGLAVGGAGNDTIYLDGAGTVVCGKGNDEVALQGLGVGPWLSRTCERIGVSEADSYELGPLFIRPPHPVGVTRDGRLVFNVPCLPERGRACAQRLTVTRPHAPFDRLSTRRFKTRQAGRRIAIPIPARFVREARRRPVRLRVRLDGVIHRVDTEVSVVWRFDLDLRAR